MYEVVTRGVISQKGWDEVRGVVRKFDYVDIRDYMWDTLVSNIKTRLGVLESTLVSKMKNNDEVRALKAILDDPYNNSKIEYAMNHYGTTFNLHDYKIIKQACHISKSFNGLFNGMKELERGTLSDVFVTQEEVSNIFWLRNNKQVLKQLVFEEYKHVLEDKEKEGNTNG